MHLGAYATKQLTDAEPSGIPPDVSGVGGDGSIMILLMVSGYGFGRKR
jgi:hypothetical protein